MNWITKFAPPVMFGLFVILAIATAATALPRLVVPLIAAFIAVLLLALIVRILK